MKTDVPFTQIYMVRYSTTKPLETNAVFKKYCEKSFTPLGHWNKDMLPSSKKIILYPPCHEFIAFLKQYEPNK